MPDPFESLLIVATGLRGTADHRRVEKSVACKRSSQLRIVRSPILRMAAKLFGAEPEPAVPLDRAWQSAGSLFDLRFLEARIEYESLDVPVEK